MTSVIQTNNKLSKIVKLESYFSDFTTQLNEFRTSHQNLTDYQAVKIDMLINLSKSTSLDFIDIKTNSNNEQIEEFFNKNSKILTNIKNSFELLKNEIEMTQTQENSSFDLNIIEDLNAFKETIKQEQINISDEIDENMQGLEDKLEDLKQFVSKEEYELYKKRN